MTADAFALIVFLLPLAWSPGPGNLFFAALGAQSGLRASWPASLGYHAATLLVTFAIGLGFGARASRITDLAQIMAMLGAGYVLWMAWRFWQAGGVGGTSGIRRARILDGAILLILNPKAYAIIAAMFAQFLSADADALRVVWITCLFTLNNLLAFTVWTWAGTRLLRHWQHDATARRLNRGAAVGLAGVAVWMVLR